MPLEDVELPVVEAELPRDVRSFLREADRRIVRYQRTSHVHGFVPGDYPAAYHLLSAVAAADLAPGRLFCEWGSGFGVVTCLAAMLDFDAYGIEIEGELVDAARQLADDFDLPVEFARGSFIPEGGEAYLDVGDAFAWLTAVAGDTEDELGLATDDFDLIYAYPWPDEEWVTGALFRRYAAVGALLATYHVGEGYCLRRKTRRRSGRRCDQRR